MRSLGLSISKGLFITPVQRYIHRAFVAASPVAKEKFEYLRGEQYNWWSRRLKGCLEAV